MNDLDEARKKVGWPKIEATCKLAARHNIQYAWIDTCCIDKTNLAELSEAINSMFKWYQGAIICYAYLQDLSDAHGVSLTHGPSWTEYAEAKFELRKCRWFTRGWTLQELLAPGQVEFYSVNWFKVGGKDTLGELLSDITNIDVQVLTGQNNMHYVPVNQRMMWAAKRETSRVEDMVYSLIGIFDVNIPLLYGEGWKAFQRLQEEIIRTTNDLTITSWAADWSGESFVPPKYRPPAWRHAESSPAFRGPLAWAPAEFVPAAWSSRDTLVQDNSMTMANGSLILQSKLGYRAWERKGKSELFLLRLAGGLSPKKRRLVFTPFGYAFYFLGPDEKEQLPHSVQSDSLQTIKFASYREATLLGQQPHSLVHVQVVTRLPRPEVTGTWPAERFDKLENSMAYTLPQLSKLSQDSPMMIGLFGFKLPFTQLIQPIFFSFYIGLSSSMQGSDTPQFWSIAQVLKPADLNTSSRITVSDLERRVGGDGLQNWHRRKEHTPCFLGRDERGYELRLWSELKQVSETEAVAKIRMRFQFCIHFEARVESGEWHDSKSLDCPLTQV